MRRALNLSSGIGELQPIGALPERTVRTNFARRAEADFRAPLLTAALILLLADLLIAYVLRGLLRRRPAQIAAGLAMALLLVPGIARAEDSFAIRASSEFHLAYVTTGDEAVDSVSLAGLTGLSDILNQRTAVEAAKPIGVDIEHDQLVFLSLIHI